MQTRVGPRILRYPLSMQWKASRIRIMKKLDPGTIGGSKVEIILCELLDSEFAKNRNRALNILEDQNRINRNLDKLIGTESWTYVFELVNGELIEKAKDINLNQKCSSFLLNVMKTRIKRKREWGARI